MPSNTKAEGSWQITFSNPDSATTVQLGSSEATQYEDPCRVLRRDSWGWKERETEAALKPGPDRTRSFLMTCQDSANTGSGKDREIGQLGLAGQERPWLRTSFSFRLFRHGLIPMCYESLSSRVVGANHEGTGLRSIEEDGYGEKATEPTEHLAEPVRAQENQISPG